MSLKESTPIGETHSIDLEVSASEIPLIRAILQQIQIGERDDIRNVRVAIEAERPLNLDLTGDTTPEPEPETTDTDAEESEETEESEESEINVSIHGDTSQFEESDAEESDAEEPESVYLDTDTKEFQVAAILYRSNPLQLGEIHELIENTKWEIKYKTVSAILSKLRDKGIVRKNKQYAGKWRLTEKGEKEVKYLAASGDEYPLTMADKITGLAPTV